MENQSIDQSVVNALLKDRKSDRRWRNFRFFFWMILILFYTFMIFGPSLPSDSDTTNKPYVSLIRLDGVIMPDSAFSAEKVIPQLMDAFQDKKARGVVLLINSPGGSPVQAAIIHDKIIELKHRYKKTVVVVGEDALASGAYLVATAADDIYVNQDTLTGSIGVIMSGFGFTDAMEKVGITRRVFTAGTLKDRLDPFEKLNPADITKVNQLLTEVHQNFIDDVTQGRGNRLRGNKDELFSGDFWTGSQAVQLGLADGTENLWTVLDEQFKVHHYRDYSARPGFFQEIFKEVSSELNLSLMNQTAPLKEQAY